MNISHFSGMWVTVSGSPLQSSNGVCCLDDTS